MTDGECKLFMDAELPCYTRVSTGKVRVLILAKVDKPGRGYKTTTEWTVKRIDNDRVLTARNCRALHKTQDFRDD